MIFSYLLNMQSHPSWVCGLKLTPAAGYYVAGKSHPSWVCGLKQTPTKDGMQSTCHTLRGCVD